jgi:drug/metabolite transporter (DMT)-like permease
LRSVSRGDFAALVLLGSVFATGQSALYFNALLEIPISTATLISWVFPVFVIGLTVILGLESLTKQKVMALSVSLIGVGLVVGGLAGFELLGAALTVAASLVYTGYLVLGSQVLSRCHPLLSSNVVVASAATAIWLGALFIWEPQLPDQETGWLSVLGLGIVCTAFPTVALFAGLRLIGASWGAITSTAEPLVAVFLSYLAYSERLSPIQLVGAVFILAGGILLPLLSEVRKTQDEADNAKSHVLSRRLPTPE